MAHFRKLLFALAVILVATVTASAQVSPTQITCTASVAVPPNVRAEGLAELVGDVYLVCSGGTPTALGQNVPRVNIQVWLNTNITSRLTDPSDTSATEALLLIDDPIPANQRECTYNTPSPTYCAATYPVVGTGTGVNYAGGAAPNVYQGRYAAANSIVWMGVPVDPPGTTATRTLRIKNIRANANQLGVSSTLTPTSIIEYISISGETSITVNNPQQVVGWVLPGLSVSMRDKCGDSLASGGASLLQCVSNNPDIYGDNTKKLQHDLTFRVRMSEGFGTAFKLRKYSSPYDPTDILTPQAEPTGIGPGNAFYNTETGFYNPAFTSNKGLNRAGLADSGTRLRLFFNNVPAGVAIFVTTTSVGNTGGNSARLVSTDANGAGAYSAVSATSTGSSTCAGTVDLAPVTISGGSGVAVWEIVATDPLQIGRVELGVAVAYKANTAANLPGLGTATVSGSFAPISTVTTMSTSAPLPRFADTGSAKNAFVINPCQTNLLFPFVSNQAGFDTGIAIANTSQDPFGTAAQTGACTLNYYGQTAGGGAAPAAQTSGTVAAGDTLVFTLSAGGSHGITATPGFQGYIIAQCKFQYAHGFAFISDLGAAKVSHGYLALILDGALGSRTGFLSETLGQ